MKTLLFLFKFKKKNGVLLSLLLLTSWLIEAQDDSRQLTLPVIVSLFSESVSLPNFRGLFKSPGWGVRIGTEFYYSQKENRQLLQTLHLGYYHHSGFQQGIWLNSEFGYRKFVGNFFADATIGAGYLHLISELKRYKPNGDAYAPASQRLHKFMPSLGLGLGYQFNNVAIFSRYELFGEIPFNYKGTPVLPHKTLHAGIRIQSLSSSSKN